MKTFTGDEEQYKKCKKYLFGLGYSVSDAIHIGNNKFEFQEDYNKGMGCHNMHTILAWIENETIKTKVKVIGFMCMD